MIFLDPDLDSDQSPKAKLKRSAAPTPRAHSRSNRIPSERTLTRFLEEAQSAVKLRGRVAVLLTTDKAIRRLNRQFRRKNNATDVLSFPAYVPRVPRGERPRTPAIERLVGDLAISVPTARKQAAAQGHPLGVEIKVLMLHGLLHLAGFDHERDEGEMARREETLRAKLGLPVGLIERAEAAGSSPPTHSAIKLRNGWGSQREVRR